MNIAFLFSGQGSQMDKLFQSFYEKSGIFRKEIEHLQEYTDLDLIEIGTKYNRHQSKPTRIIQPALLAKELAITDILANKGITPTVVAGMSLGQFAAMHASGMISSIQAMKIVEKRSLLMSKDVADIPTAMVAVLSNNMKQIFQMIEHNKLNNIYPSNFNSETQVVFGGPQQVMKKLADIVNESSIGKAILLNNEGAFHTPYFSNTENGLRAFLSNYSKFSSYIPLIENETGKLVNLMTAESISKHSVRPVMWQQSMITLKKMNPELIIEIGSGSPLRNLLPKNTNKYLSIETYEDLLQLDSII